MPALVVLIVLAGILSGVVYGANHWQTFGKSVLEGVFWGGAVGAGVSAFMVLVLSFFHSFGKGVEWFAKAATRARFWVATLLGTLSAWSFMNVLLASIAYADDPKKEWNVTMLAARKLFQAPWSIDWALLLEGFAVLWPWYVISSLFAGFFAVIINLDIPEPERAPWYVTLLTIVGLALGAFPPTLYLAFYAFIALIVVAFVVMVVLLLYFAMIGSPGFFLKLHRKPFRFSVFYAGIGGSVGTYITIQTSILGTQFATSPQMIAVGFVAGSVAALFVALMLRRVFGIQWDPVFT